MRTCCKRSINSAGKCHEGGFTFAEMLLSFSLFLVLVSFFPLGVNMLLGQGLLAEDLQKMEWEVFISQAKKEIRMSDELMITGDCLLIRTNTHLVEYKMWGSNLRRRVDGQGHELILQQVQTAAFEPVQQGVRIHVSDTFGRNYSMLIRTPVKEDSNGT